MAIILASNFDINATLPIDSRFVVADATARDAIDAGVRYEGLIVYVTADGLHYALVGGITNGDWSTIGGGGGSGNFTVDRFSGDGSDVTFTLSTDPGSENNMFVYVSGVYQQKDTYSVATTTLTFSTAPPLGTDNIEVTYSTPTSIGTPSDNSVSTVKLQDDAVTTPKIDDGAVTRAKREAIGQQISSSCSNFTSSSTSATDITNLTVNITTTGKPVVLGLISDGSGNVSNLLVNPTAGTTTISSFYTFVRNGTTIAEQEVGNIVNSSGTVHSIRVPASSLSHIDPAAAGTYTYKVQVRCAVDTGVGVNYAKLIAYEL